MQNIEAGLPEINALEVQAARAAQSGRDQEAVALWGRILEIDPSHARSLTALGLRAFHKGDLQGARAAFQRLIDASTAQRANARPCWTSSSPQRWAVSWNSGSSAKIRHK